ncbi:hypothetical protein HM1_0264 [Heliomicrobium modesticaldum Ice1]|uniref:Uncharacterized protein n=1 Tax=Heliobacterium modesticaldum (strain ATCC 51547 / Ice1) TaxID=498761 RepID=B0TEG4_HELMI|nr:hypothetical protein [Heliomicrobium modesticaldum]ABZ82883.1 hypothetical protein HM1_0264 [Heliomicrobium modesticaldum Ice1]
MLYLFFIIAALATMAATVTAMGNYTWSSVRTQARAEQLLYSAESGIEAALAAAEDWLKRRPDWESPPEAASLASHLAARLPGFSLGESKVRLTYRTVTGKPFSLDVIASAEGDGGRFAMLARLGMEKREAGLWQVSSVERSLLRSVSAR